MGGFLDWLLGKPVRSATGKGRATRRQEPSPRVSTPPTPRPPAGNGPAPARERLRLHDPELARRILQQWLREKDGP